jgi:hypothetical protein
MEPPIPPLFFALLLLIGTLLLTEIDYRLSVRRHLKNSGSSRRRTPKLSATKQLIPAINTSGRRNQ